MLTSVDVRTGLAFTPIGMLLDLRDELATQVDDDRHAPAFSATSGVGASVRLATVDDEIERRAAAWLHRTAGAAATGWRGGWRGALGRWDGRHGLFGAEITGIRVGGVVRLRTRVSTPRCRPDLARRLPVETDTSAPFWRCRAAVAEAQARVDRTIEELGARVAVPETVDDIEGTDLGRVFGLTVRVCRIRPLTGTEMATVAIPAMVLGARGEEVWPVDTGELRPDTPVELRPTASEDGVPRLLFAGAQRRRELVEWCLDDLRRAAPVS